MGGFTKTLNFDFRQGLFEIIINALIDSSVLMKQNCLDSGVKLENHEEKIRTHLLENYLENSKIRSAIGLTGIALRFIPEVPETYYQNEDSYKGRTDIKVVSANWLFNDKNDYYVVECKRIDGSSNLNKKYIDEGVCRFVIPPPKYSSFHNKNIMFAFVVQNLDVHNNINKICKCHQDKLKSLTCKEISLVKDFNEKQCSVYESEYVADNENLKLSHIFFDFAPIII